jgi:hypothetical protein
MIYGIFSRELDPGLEEPIATLIWATPRLQADVVELKNVADQLTAKYGKEFGWIWLKWHIVCLSNFNHVSFNQYLRWSLHT